MQQVVKNNNRPLTTIIVIAVIALAAFVAYSMMHAPDRRTAGDRVGDAVDNLGKGNIGDAAGSFKDKTPGEKIGDAVKDAGDSIKRSTE